MSEVTNKLYFDVSHILAWPGRLTGIERVEYHLIKHYFFNRPEIIFVNWDKTRNNFEILDRSIVENKIINRRSEKELHESQSSPEKSLKIKKLTKKINKIFKKKWHPTRGKLIIPAGLWDDEAYITKIRELSKRVSIIHVVFDVIPIIHEDYFADFLPVVFKKYMFAVLPGCKCIMAISKSTAKDTKKVLLQKNLRVPKIISFTLGNDLTRADKAVEPKGFKGDFILAVSTVEYRKNHQMLYSLYKQLIKSGINPPRIIVAGKRGWKSDEFQNNIQNDTDINEHIKILDKVSDAQLRWLYENCLFTIFPSFYEGWGLPVIESLNYGKVTLSSNTSSMPEAGGEFADYFSPDSVAELEKLVKKYLDEVTRRSREKFIRQNYKPVSWVAAARNFAALVDNC